ncbi:MAG: hypothetical protein J7521_20410 [Caulobacter sp.]|nr:hypothetical protein [Caulobacter sp.]
MVAGVTASIAVNIKSQLVGVGDLGTPRVPVNVEALLSLTAGTDATSKANVLFADTRTLAASATENLDLAGALADALGATFTAAEVVAIYVKAAAGNTNSVVLFGAASNAFNGPLSGTTPKLTLAPGDFALLTCKNGWTVTAGTGDLILVANSGSGTPVSYDIVVIGRTVAA